MSVEKTLEKLLRGASDANIRFDEIAIYCRRKVFECAFPAAIISSQSLESWNASICNAKDPRQSRIK